MIEDIKEIYEMCRNMWSDILIVTEEFFDNMNGNIYEEDD
jgi:hypothetical protein